MHELGPNYGSPDYTGLRPDSIRRAVICPSFGGFATRMLFRGTCDCSSVVASLLHSEQSHVPCCRSVRLFVACSYATTGLRSKLLRPSVAYSQAPPNLTALQSSTFLPEGGTSSPPDPLGSAFSLGHAWEHAGGFAPRTPTVRSRLGRVWFVPHHTLPRSTSPFCCICDITVACRAHKSPHLSFLEIRRLVSMLWSVRVRLSCPNVPSLLESRSSTLVSLVLMGPDRRTCGLRPCPGPSARLPAAGKS